MAGRRLPAYPVYLALSFASSLFYTMVFTISAVYRVERAGLNPFQLVLVGTVLEASIFLFEIPTGVVADVHSRRLSIIIGLFLIGAAFLLEGSLPLFATILIAQAIWGIGFTFTSGATGAWIADEVGDEAIVGRIFLRGAQASQVGALLGTFVSVALASIRLNLPIVIAGGLFVALAIALILVMPERHFTPTPREERSSWQSMGDTLRGGVGAVRRRPVLVTILLIGGFYGMSSEAFDRLWPVHFLDNFTFPRLGDFDPVVWFGIMNVGAMLLSVIAAEIVRRRVDTGSHLGAARALIVVNGLLIVSVVAFGLAGNFAVALAAYWVTYLLRETNDPIYDAWVNQGLDSRVRATVMSMSSQANALGQIAGGPILGALATVVSIRAAMVAVGATLSPSILLFARTIWRGGAGLALPTREGGSAAARGSRSRGGQARGYAVPDSGDGVAGSAEGALEDERDLGAR